MKYLRFTAIWLFSLVAFGLCQTADQLIQQLEPLGTGGTDAQARKDLLAMTQESMKPPIDEDARLTHVQALLNGLETVTDASIRRDLMVHHLGWVGKQETVEALSGYFSDVDDGVYAVMAVYQICREMGWDNCAAVSIEVLDKAQTPDLSVQMLSKDKIRISVSMDDYKIKITDIKGKEVWSNSGRVPGKHDLPLSLFHVGIYVVKAKSGDRSISKRVALY